MLKKHLFPLSVLILSMTGLLLAYALAEEFYFMDLPQIDGHQAGFLTTISAQVCGKASTFFSCQSVSQSRYAFLFGFPMALYGVLYYALLFLMGLGCWVGRASVKKTMVATLFWLAAVGLAIDVALFYISYVKIKALCPLCLLTYGINLVLVVLTLVYTIASGLNPTNLFELFRSADGRLQPASLVIHISVLLLMIVAAAGLSFAANRFLIQSKIDFLETHKQGEMQKIVTTFLNQPQEQVQLPALLVHGEADAPVTIIEVSDFLCPYCARTSQILDELIKENPGKLRVLFVNFPLDIDCNRYMRARMHQGACELAKGAVCAASLGKLLPYESTAFGNQKKKSSKEEVSNIAASAGIDPALFTQCLQDSSTMRTLQWQIEAAHAYKIDSTPTIFINYKRYQGRIYKEVLQQIIDIEAKGVTANQ
ncbi:MAG: thioredoxin domain-containing protein [Desulfobacteraceae bacterium]|nr:thioredoxin domain-containing protein [Desulfobacteraceae bacterium]